MPLSEKSGRLEVGVATRNDGEPDAVYFQITDDDTGDYRIMYLTPGDAIALARTLEESAAEARGTKN